MTQFLLAIDQGTTSSRAIVFNSQGSPIAQHQIPLQQIFPADGWVEHNAEEIWNAVLTCCRTALQNANLSAEQIAAIGITNQRETTIIWDRVTGKPIYHAIVWQDRRTADWCEKLKQEGYDDVVQEKTGLLLDPYFSATKISWILDNVPGARARAEKGELAFGTVDCFLLWNLTGGRSHKTDATNASRTLIFNIHQQQWDYELLAKFNVPEAILPEVMDCCADFGDSLSELFGAPIKIAGIAGDQQAALVGQACFEPGMVKSTYGTGCFMVMNTGAKSITSTHRMLTTVGYRINGEVTYAVEGSIFIAGAAIQWLRDGLKIIQDAKETEQLAINTGENNSVYLVPAFTGLGAPYWDPHARGAIFGLNRNTGIAEVVTAGLQSVCYQTADLLNAMIDDGAAAPTTLRVDGGMVVNNWLVQFLSDILQVTVDRPTVTETTALGAVYLAGLQVGVFKSLEEIAGLWQREHRFECQMPKEQQQHLYAGWLNAVKRVMQE